MRERERRERYVIVVVMMMARCASTRTKKCMIEQSIGRQPTTAWPSMRGRASGRTAYERSSLMGKFSEIKCPSVSMMTRFSSNSILKVRAAVVGHVNRRGNTM